MQLYKPIEDPLERSVASRESHDGDSLSDCGLGQHCGEWLWPAGADGQAGGTLKPQAVGEAARTGDLGQPLRPVGLDMNLRRECVNEGVNLLDAAAGHEQSAENHRQAGIEGLDFVEQMAGDQEAP